MKQCILFQRKNTLFIVILHRVIVCVTALIKKVQSRNMTRLAGLPGMGNTLNIFPKIYFIRECVHVHGESMVTNNIMVALLF